MQINAEASTSKYYRSIDFAKGILILLVVITHFAWQEKERLLLLFPFWVDMAVPLFMVISGFVYAKSMEKQRITAAGQGDSAAALLGRVIRYTLPFAVVFAAEEILFFAVFGARHSLSQIATAFLNGGYGHGSYYYPIMMQLVFYFPVIYAIVRKYDFKGLLLCGAINFLYEILKSAYGISADSYRLLVFRYTLPVAYGCYMAMDSYVRRKKLSVFCAVVGIAYIVLCKYLNVVPPVTRFWTGTSMWACLYVIPFAKPLLVNKCKNAAVEVVGRASYHIFLVQMVYYGLFGASYVYRYVENRWLQLGISLAICVSGGVLFYCVETPISKLVRKKAKVLWNSVGC